MVDAALTGQDRPRAGGAAVIIRGMPEARRVIALARQVGVIPVLISDPGAAAFAGPGWWRALVAEIHGQEPAAFHALLDCADSPGLVMAALREGVRDICARLTPPVRAKLADMAAQSGARLWEPPVRTLDLRRCRDDVSLRLFLAQAGEFTAT